MSRQHIPSARLKPCHVGRRAYGWHRRDIEWWSQAIAHAITMGEAPFCAGASAGTHAHRGQSDTQVPRFDEAVIDGTLFCAIIDAMTRFPDSIALLQWAATAISLIRDNHRGKSRFVYITSSITGESSLRVLKNASRLGSEGVARMYWLSVRARGELYSYAKTDFRSCASACHAVDFGRCSVISFAANLILFASGCETTRQERTKFTPALERTENTIRSS